MLRTLLAPAIVDSLTAPAGAWAQVDVVDVVDSTNAESLRTPVPWRVVVAERQESGRGRHSRVWVSPPGSSVAMSMTVPLSPRPEEWGWVPLLTGLAVRDAIAHVCGDDIEVALKWPNDVLVRAAGSGDDPRKVCGILCESTGDLVVAGVGVNVTVPAEELPVPTATSLHLEGFAGDRGREQIVVAVARMFARRYEALVAGGSFVDGVRAAYRSACSTVGADVTIHVPTDETVAGRAVDVDDEGRLVIEVDGQHHAYAAGDVVHVRRAQQA